VSDFNYLGCKGALFIKSVGRSVWNKRITALSGCGAALRFTFLAVLLEMLNTEQFLAGGTLNSLDPREQRSVFWQIFYLLVLINFFIVKWPYFTLKLFNLAFKFTVTHTHAFPELSRDRIQARHQLIIDPFQVLRLPR
jgi:hypothetical protein